LLSTAAIELDLPGMLESA